MNTLKESPGREPPSTARDVFEVLDECHRQTLAALDTLEALVARVEGGDSADAQTRASAADVVRHFSSTVRQHHDDEERHVFPKLVLNAQPHIVQAVLRLQQDHDWLEEDWMELSPHVEAIASGDTNLNFDLSNIHLVASDGRAMSLQIEPVKLTVKQ